MRDPQPILASFSPATAWEPFFPNASQRWDLTRAGHLLRRAAFGVTREQLEAAVDRGLQASVDTIVTGAPGQREFERSAAALQIGVVDSGDIRQLQALWFHRLLNSPHPLQERMTLFWHNHFATSHAKVQDVSLMNRQHETLRRHSLGHFGELLQEMTRDPAMLVWLDADSNRKGAPNENYAREVFELFSLGDGNYTEQDIKEAARALTGWSVRDREAVFDPSQHDDGEKTIFGRTGRWSSGDVVRLCLEQDACAVFLVRKLFREFVSDVAEPSEELLAPLADGFRVRNYDIAWLVHRMLSSWVFYSDAAIHQRVKSPIEFVVGTVPALGGSVSPRDAADVCSKMGQSLYLPPSVKGWDGGEEWINSSTLLARQNFAFDVTRGAGGALRCDPAQLAMHHELHDSAEMARFFLELFHQQVDAGAVNTIREQIEREQSGTSAAQLAGRARTAAHLALTMPEYLLG